jgi:hypothetical protein
MESESLLPSTVWKYYKTIQNLGLKSDYDDLTHRLQSHQYHLALLNENEPKLVCKSWRQFALLSSNNFDDHHYVPDATRDHRKLVEYYRPDGFFDFGENFRIRLVFNFRVERDFSFSPPNVPNHFRQNLANEVAKHLELFDRPLITTWFWRMSANARTNVRCYTNVTIRLHAIGYISQIFKTIDRPPGFEIKAPKIIHTACHTSPVTGWFVVIFFC